MKMFKSSYLRSLCTAVAISASGQQAYAMQPQQVGNIIYMTGGIGEEERQAMQSVKNDYNLSLVSADKSGAYVGDTQVVISDREGKELLNTESGPLFYAELPPGRYVVEGTSQGQTRQQNVTIAEGKPAHVQFSWK